MAVRTLIDCDKCDCRVVWHTHIGKLLAKKWARENGWTCGKRDLCPKCNNKKVKPEEEV